MIHYWWDGLCSIAPRKSLSLLALLLACIPFMNIETKVWRHTYLAFYFHVQYFVSNVIILTNAIFPYSTIIYLQYLSCSSFFGPIFWRDFLIINRLGFVKKSPSTVVYTKQRRKCPLAMQCMVWCLSLRETHHRVEGTFCQRFRIKASAFSNCCKKKKITY